MGKVIFDSQIAGMGKEAANFNDEKMVILFGEDFVSVVPELERYCTLLCNHTLSEEILPGDTLYLEETSYTITAVGEVACKNLKELGHCVLVFDGAGKAQLPGNLHVEEKEMTPLYTGMLMLITRE